MSPIEKQKIMKEAQAYLNSQMYKCVKEKGYGVMLGKNLNTRWDILMATLHCIKIFTQVRFNKCYRAMYRYMFFSNLSMLQNFHVLILGCKCFFHDLSIYLSVNYATIKCFAKAGCTLSNFTHTIDKHWKMKEGDLNKRPLNRRFLNIFWLLMLTAPVSPMSTSSSCSTRTTFSWEVWRERTTNRRTNSRWVGGPDGVLC